jgi:hypothetical protein
VSRGTRHVLSATHGQAGRQRVEWYWYGAAYRYHTNATAGHCATATPGELPLSLLHYSRFTRFIKNDIKTSIFK